MLIMLIWSALREYLPYASVTLGLAVKLATSGGFPPFGAYGTTFLHGKASHLVLRSLSLPYEPSSLATPLCGESPAERARGNAFPSPARAVVWFYHNGALYFFRGAHQDR